MGGGAGGAVHQLQAVAHAHRGAGRNRRGGRQQLRLRQPCGDGDCGREEWGGGGRRGEAAAAVRGGGEPWGAGSSAGPLAGIVTTTACDFHCLGPPSGPSASDGGATQTPLRTQAAIGPPDPRRQLAPTAKSPERAQARASRARAAIPWRGIVPRRDLGGGAGGVDRLRDMYMCCPAAAEAPRQRAERRRVAKCGWRVCCEAPLLPEGRQQCGKCMQPAGNAGNATAATSPAQRSAAQRPRRDGAPMLTQCEVVCPTVLLAGPCPYNCVQTESSCAAQPCSGSAAGCYATAPSAAVGCNRRRSSTASGGSSRL